MAAETILNGRYELVAQQGSGGMSIIYRALDRALGRTVAVKVLRPSLITQDAGFLERFRDEARSVARLSHPNIVTVHDVGNDGPTHYIVMELVEGTDLKKIIKAQGAMPIERVLKLAIQICAGIGYAHRSGLVHADIKPQNILVTPQDVVKVTDFGIAQAMSDTQPQTRAEVVWGSPHYFAPEQARGEQPTPASDVYAIGIVMFEMLTGRLPYGGVNMQELALAHIRERIPLVTELNPSVPEALAAIVQKVMSKEPHGRYRMADQLGQVLQDYRDRSRSATLNTPQVPSQGAQVPSQGAQVPSQGAQVPPAINAPAGSLPTVPHTPQVPSQGAQVPSQGAQVLSQGAQVLSQGAQVLSQGAQVPPAINAPAARSTAEPTAKFSPAPSAPQPYNPRSVQPSVSAPTPPQPLVQNYMPPPPQPARGDSRQFTNPSQPLRPIADDEGVDWVTIALAILAIIAVLGLFPVWIAALLARA